eukprot:GHVH01014431.1.p1 GENE.GHVH01014431.1~~GHVH01014431.1.p1  ORF type:complete len:113 (-),score=3.38 GHVH01014431.1:190-528(-)
MQHIRLLPTVAPIHPLPSPTDYPLRSSTSEEPIILEKTFATDSPPVLIALKQPIPTFSNVRVDNREKKRCLQQLLTQGSLTPAPQGTDSYLDAHFILGKRWYELWYELCCNC